MGELAYWSVLGDSISTFQGFTPPGGVYYAPSSGSVTGVNRVEDTWWWKLIQAGGGRLLANNSWSGSTVAESGNLGAASLSRIRKLGPEGASPDVVLIFTGLNDVSRYVPLETFRADYEVMVRRVRTRFPAAKVLCGTLVTGYIERPLFPRLTHFGKRLADYNDAIREAVRSADGAIADLAALEEFYESMDGIHPTGVGMEQVAGMWVRSLGRAAP